MSFLPAISVLVRLLLYRSAEIGARKELLDTQEGNTKINDLEISMPINLLYITYVMSWIKTSSQTFNGLQIKVKCIEEKNLDGVTPSIADPTSVYWAVRDHLLVF